MKKTLSILFATVLIFAFAFILTSCDGDGADIQGTDIKSTLLTVGDETLTATLPNATESFSFIKDIEVAENAEYILSGDISCDTVISSKTVPLEPGDNTYYILVTNGNKQQLYTVTIRRLPMYTVTFNSNSGTPVDSQTVEEGSLATEPTTSRDGYTFASWNYDFTKPIMSNTEISASWAPNSGTAYKVEYYLESVTEEFKFDLVHTDIFAGEAGSTVTAEIKNYEHFTYSSSRSKSSGEIAGDGSLTLKLYCITIPNSVTTIYNSAFEGCISLKSIVIPNSVTQIDSSAFKNCKKMTQITIPDSVTSIGSAAFSNCSELSILTLPNNITEIASSMVYGCSKLSSITIPEKVIKIGSWAFSNCTSLESIIIPDKVKKIESYTFNKCTNLTSITLVNKSGWTVNGNSISSSELENKSTAADYFKNTYYSYEWTRS